MPHPRFIDLTGQRFAKLTALERVFGHKDTRWRCLCDCGRETVVSSHSLRTRKIMSCGCAQREWRKQLGVHQCGSVLSKPGQQYAFWTLVSPIDRASWLARCVCGAVKKIWIAHLRKGIGAQSCGCKGRRAKTPTKYGPVRADRIPEYGIWQGIKRRCERETDHEYKYYGGRGIRMCDRWRNNFQAFREDMGPRPSSRHEIDRIDNNGNYEPGNCRWATRKQQMRNTRKNHIITVGDKSMTMVEWSEVSGIQTILIHARLRAGWSEQDAVTIQPGLGFILRAARRPMARRCNQTG